MRFPAPKPADGHLKTTLSTEHHEELDELFDNLNLAESTPRTSLRELLLSEGEDRFEQLKNVLSERLEEGFGEAVFELGYENNGDSMKLTLDEWELAQKRLREAAKEIHAECDILLTKNVGGDKEAPSNIEKPGKDRSSSGKMLIRQSPTNIEDVIETRIAVVGNGELLCR